MEGRRTATLQQLIARVQRRWGAHALRWSSDPSAPPATLPTGFEQLDDALGIGGVPRGRITELLGMPTSGMTTIALSLIAHAQAAGYLASYVDLSHTFDAEYAALLGVDLAALLLVRPESTADALQIMQALVASGGLGVLVVDSLAQLQAAPADAALLERALRVLLGSMALSSCALVVLTPLPYGSSMTQSIGFLGSLVGHAAAIRLHVAREAWLLAAHGAPGCHARITILKHQLGTMGGDIQVLIRFYDEAGP